MTAEAEEIYLDNSKNLITDETLHLLRDLVESLDLRTPIQAMLRGDNINISEKGAVLHTALRAPRNISIFVDGKDVAGCSRGVGSNGEFFPASQKQ